MRKRRIKKPNWGKTGVYLGGAGILVAIVLFVLSTFIFSPVKNINKFLTTYSNLESEKGEIVLFPKGFPSDINDRIQQLEKDINKVESSPFLSLSAESYFRLSEFYFNYTDIKKSLDFINKAISKNENIPKYYILRAIDNSYLGLFSNAKNDINSALQYASNSKLENKIVISSHLLNSMLFYLDGNLLKSADSLHKFLNLPSPDEKLDKLKLFGYYFLENIYFSLAEYEKSEFYFMKTKDLRKQLEQSNMKDEITYFLLCITAQSPDVSKAYAYFLHNADPNNTFITIIKYLYQAASAIYNDEEAEFKKNLAMCFELTKERGLNLFSHMLDLDFFEYQYLVAGGLNYNLINRIRESPIKIPLWEAGVYELLGKYYWARNDAKKAKEYLNLALNIFTKSGVVKEIGMVNFLLGLIEFDLKNYGNTRDHFMLSLQYINKLKEASDRIGKDKVFQDRTRAEIEEPLKALDTIEKFIK